MQKRANAVTFKECKPYTLVGPQLKAWAIRPPDFACVTAGLEVVGIKQTPCQGSRLFSVVPSLDAPVCSLQTKKFEETLASMKDQVSAYTVSLDLTIRTEAILRRRRALLTCIRSFGCPNHSFGENYGVLLEGLPLSLLCRAVFVVDRQGKLTHVEYVMDVPQHPNYDAAVAALKAAAV